MYIYTFVLYLYIYVHILYYTYIYISSYYIVGNLSLNSLEMYPFSLRQIVLQTSYHSPSELENMWRRSKRQTAVVSVRDKSRSLSSELRTKFLQTLPAPPPAPPGVGGKLCCCFFREKVWMLPNIAGSLHCCPSSLK